MARPRRPAEAGRRHVYLSYFGTARPDYYGIKAIPLAGFIDRRPPQPPDALGGGVYCISATVSTFRSIVLQAEDETNYQAALQNLVAFARARRTRPPGPRCCDRPVNSIWHDLFRQFDQLRTGRLVALSAIVSRRHGRLLDPDLPADRWRGRAGGNGPAPGGL